MLTSNLWKNAKTFRILDFKNPKYISSQIISINDIVGTHEDERTVLYKTKLLDGTKPNTNPNLNTNPIQLFYAFLIIVRWSPV